MIEFIEYSDEKICIRLPKQLRQRHGMRLFQGNLVRGKPETEMSIALDLDLDTQRVECIKELYLRPGIKDRGPNETLERLGPCEFGEDGMELLTSIVQPDTGEISYSWSMFYSLHGTYVMFMILGDGSREEFENIAREIILSLVII